MANHQRNLSKLSKSVNQFSLIKKYTKVTQKKKLQNCQFFVKRRKKKKTEHQQINKQMNKS